MTFPPPKPTVFLGDQHYSGYSNDPVNTATGNFTYEDTDLSITTRGMPFELRRYYNSRSTAGGPLGIGWTYNFNIALDANAPSNQVAVCWDDGRTDYWIDDGMGGYEPSLPSLFDALTDNNDGTWTVVRKNLDVYEFDSLGRLTSMADKNGNTTTLAYSEPNEPMLVSTVTDPAGRTLTLAYDPNSALLASVTDFAVPPRTVTYGYTAGRLTQVIDTLGNPIGYGYDTSGYLATITDQRGVTTVTNTYDALGRVIQQLDGNGNPTTFEYDTPSLGQTRLTGYLGDPNSPDLLETIHTHEVVYYRLTSITNPLGEVVSYGYDENFERTSITDRNGNVTSFVYDDRGNVTETQEPDDPNDPDDGGVTIVEYPDPNDPNAPPCPDVPVRKADALGFVTKWVYDGNCNVIGEVRYLDLSQSQPVTRSWSYNGFGQRETETDECSNVHQWIYDGLGRLIEEIDRETNSTWYGYDELWRRNSVTDGRGSGPGDPAYTTTFTYDDADRLTEIAGPPLAGNPNGITRSFEYDEVGNRTHVTDGNGNTTVSFYDNNSNLTRTEEPLDGNPQGRVTQHFYDELNRRIATIDANNHTTQFGYDDWGRLLLRQDAEGNQWSYTYDAHGNVLTETDPSVVTLVYEYDSQHRRKVIRDELSNEQLFFYDKLGRISSTGDGNGNITQYAFDGLGRLTCVIDAANGWTEYEYDAAGNLTTNTDASGRATSIRGYDKLHRLTRAEDGNGNFYIYGYDAVGNQTLVTDATNRTTDLAYDAENRLTQIDYPGGAQVLHGYDGNGNRTSMTDPTGAGSYSYDELNRLRSSADGHGQQVQYGYDAVGNRTTVTYPDTKQVTYAYDAANRLETITDWGTRVTQYGYDGLRISSVAFPNGLIESRGYDDAGRLDSMQTNDPNGTVLDLGWVRDGVGNPTSVTEAGTLQPTLQQLVTEYDYDDDNRLTGSSQGSYQHDANGNLINRTVTATATTFTYDDEDRLVSQTTGASVVQHTYDGDGHRIARNDNGVETHYVLDRGRSMSHVLCETDPNGVITAYYIHGPQLVARIGSDASQRYYHTNDIGSVMALTDDTGQMSDRYGYTPFGLLLEQEGTTPNPFKYVGGLGVMAEADGLYFMRARFYDPDSGRFLGKDPVEGAPFEPASLHHYTYARQNSLIYTDETGEVVFLVAAIVGVTLFEEFVVKPYILPAVVEGVSKLPGSKARGYDREKTELVFDIAILPAHFLAQAGHAIKTPLVAALRQGKAAKHALGHAISAHRHWAKHFTHQALRAGLSVSLEEAFELFVQSATRNLTNYINETDMDSRFRMSGHSSRITE